MKELKTQLIARWILRYLKEYLQEKNLFIS